MLVVTVSNNSRISAYFVNRGQITGVSEGDIPTLSQWFPTIVLAKDQATGAIIESIGVGDNIAVLRSSAPNGSGSGGGISLSQAAAAAERNGIDMRMFDLAYEHDTSMGYGFMSMTLSGKIVRNKVTGRFVLTLTDLGLESEKSAVETIAHELNHIRGVMNTGEVTPEVVAEAAAEAAGANLR